MTVSTEQDQQCRNVLHIDWEADNAQGYVREDIARCILPAPHPGRRHEGRDAGGSWMRW
jgi:hypothetical protein